MGSILHVITGAHLSHPGWGNGGIWGKNTGLGGNSLETGIGTHSEALEIALAGVAGSWSSGDVMWGWLWIGASVGPG